MRPDGLQTRPVRRDGDLPRPARRQPPGRNHECSPTATIKVVAPPERTYDPAAAGGTSTLVVDRHNQKPASSISLGGSAINCSGGITPWRTWLTCEETELKAGDSGYTKDHGFIFEVDPYDDRRNNHPTAEGDGPVPARGGGDDPSDRDRYETEDAFVAPLGGFYRFLPERPRGGWGSLRAGGELQAMRIPDLPDLSVVQEAGTVFRGVEWVKVPDPLATTESVRAQDYAKPTTGGYKLEGCWWGSWTAACTSCRRSPGPSSARRSTTTARSGGTTRARRR